MSLLPGFDDAQERPPLAAKLAPRLQALADRGVYIGTSSWKYEGWLGSVYTTERYLTRGKVSTARFERECLEEYASVFRTVCGDFAFYQFPTADYWARLFVQVPGSFVFSFKVPEEITVLRWPGHARYGKRAGQGNPHFLDANLFKLAFLDALAPYRGCVGPLIFEFGTFAKKDFSDELTFFDRLGAFLSALPREWHYAVEIRNKDYLCPAYFDTLAARNVAHVFNAWTRMPELGDQICLDDAYTANFTVTRALLAHGRTYEAAVKTFQPYKAMQEPNEGARGAMIDLGQRALKRKEPAFLFVNNRLEGYAPGTIEAVIDGM